PRRPAPPSRRGSDARLDRPGHHLRFGRKDRRLHRVRDGGGDHRAAHAARRRAVLPGDVPDRRLSGHHGRHAQPVRPRARGARLRRRRGSRGLLHRGSHSRGHAGTGADPRPVRAERPGQAGEAGAGHQGARGHGEAQGVSLADRFLRAGDARLHLPGQSLDQIAPQADGLRTWPPSGREQRMRVVLATAAALVAFAANSLLCRAALGGGTADAASFTALRLASGALALVLLCRGAGGARGGSWPSAAALFAYAAAFSFAYFSLSAGVGALLLFGAVQITMIGAGIAAGERPPWSVWAGLVLALGG